MTSMEPFWQFPQAEQTALVLSLKIATWCVIISLPLGVVTGWLLGRKQFIGKSLMEVVIHLPLVMPPVATGYALLLILGNRSFLGQWLEQTFEFSFAFAWQGAVLASILVSFPLMVRAIRLSVESIDTKFEIAAKTLGASPWRVFYSITLPLMLPGILTGMVLAFVRSLGEFGATITFASNIQGETATIPLALYTALQQPGGEQIALRLALLSIGLSFIGLWGTEKASQRLQKYLWSSN